MMTITVIANIFASFMRPAVSGYDTSSQTGAEELSELCVQGMQMI